MAFPLPAKQEAAARTIHAQFLSRGIGQIDWTPVDSLTAQKRLVEAGFGIALMQESAIKEERATKALMTIKVDGLDVANPVSMIVRKNGYLSAAAQRVLDLLAKTKF